MCNVIIIIMKLIAFDFVVNAVFRFIVWGTFVCLCVSFDFYV